MPKEGDVLAGKYRIDRVLGVGGMGVVFAAKHLELGSRVALKFLLAETEPRHVERLLREARAVSKLTNEHTVRVFDVGRSPEGAPYIVMELLKGRTLSEILRSGPPLPIRAAVGYVLQACESVAEAHAHGIVHRDLKPDNLFLTERSGQPVIKVLDFGVAKHRADGTSQSITSPEAVIGSPPYMSPEQLKSSRLVDVRSDLWSLGVTLYELLTGVRPFDGASAVETCSNILNRSPRAPRSLRSEIPGALDSALLRCLERDPARRYQTVAELARCLELASGTADSGASGRVSAALSARPLPDSESIPASSPIAHAVTRLDSLETRRGLTRTVAPSSAPPLGKRPRRTVSRLLTTLGIVASACVVLVIAVLRPRFHRAEARPAQAVSTSEPTPSVSPSVPSSGTVSETAALAIPVPASASASAAAATIPSSRSHLRRTTKPLAVSASGRTAPAASSSGPIAPAQPAAPAVDTDIFKP
jgi:serine/threonine-protein kinase